MLISAEKQNPAVSVRGVSKRFGEASVLDNINFDVAEAETVVLLLP